MRRSPTFLSIGCRYFLAVVEAGSLRAAARKLNVAASAIGRQIKFLEDDLGQPLLDRSGRALSLLPAGEVLLRGLHAARLGQEEIVEHLDALQGLRRGHLRLATVESLSVALLPRSLLKFSQRHPDIHFQITVADSDTVADMVREQHADIGFTFNPKRRDGLEVATDIAFPACAVLAPQHPLAKMKRLTLAQCLAHPVAWPSEGLSLRTLLDAAPKTTDSPPRYECNSLRLMAGLAQSGHCIAFQTVIGIEQELKAGVLRLIPLRDKALPRDHLMMVRRPSQVKRPALDAFVAMMRDELASLRPVRKK